MTEKTEITAQATRLSVSNMDHANYCIRRDTGGLLDGANHRRTTAGHDGTHGYYQSGRDC